MEELASEEHSLYPVDQAPIILRNICEKGLSPRLISLFNRHPVRVVCPFPEHGDIHYTWVNIPHGL